MVPELPQSSDRHDLPRHERGDLAAELAQDPGGGAGVVTGQHPADVTGATRQRGEEQRTVGQTLVARNPDRTADPHRNLGMKAPHYSSGAGR